MYGARQWQKKRQPNLWDNKTYHYPWPPQMLKICRPFLIDELEKAMQDSSPVRKAVFIQVNQNYTETDWIIEQSKNNSTIVGIIGWVDLQDPELECVLDKYMKYAKFKGVRHIVEAESDDGWLRREDVLRGLGFLEKKGLTYDLLIRQRHFELACDVVKRFPSSGMVTEADHESWTVDDLKPFVKHVLSVFGVERCFYGSDWPVCYLATSSYGQVYQALLGALADLNDNDKISIFCKNVVKIYKLHS
ncbi:uncharacterized protein LOC110239535 isoform X2 [Exaiptasia diaphana]|uniref:Amidohydrolase-related domain-containing protein n=1 Tax=Exaiptasia diaphana TaxID=2652724 RepID=A0A913YKI9_EXADI|nr:uncharacterized protein LOC110239535 isoform X2 [Exaiptasia diaphana]